MGKSMEALRLVKKPDKGVVTFTLPETFSGKDEVEIIVLQIVDSAVKGRTVHPAELFGMYKNRGIDPDRESMELRDEWTRDT